MRYDVIACLLVVGCGGDAPRELDATAGELGWTSLVGRSWSVPAGSADTYKCIRIEVAEEMWVAGFRAIAPVGTHHTVVTISNSGSQLGEYDCQVGSLDLQMLWASGVGTDELTFPPGVAMRLRKGQFINLNLHLFNASDAMISGTSGIEALRVAPATVEHEADMTFSGTMNIDVPSDGQPHTALGGCTLNQTWNVFTVWPHMHQFATHQSFEYTKDGVTTKVLDHEPFAFAEQVNYPLATVTLNPGDKIQTTCTYVNNSGVTVRWGDSSTEEMCFTGMYKYPAGGGSLFSCALN